MAKKTEPANGNGADIKAEGPLKTLKSVYDFMIQNGLDSVEIVEDNATVKLVRRKANVQQVAVPVPVATGGMHTPVATAPAHHAAPAAHQAPPAAPAPAGTAVKSPMMGIFLMMAKIPMMRMMVDAFMSSAIAAIRAFV
jgi:biotin carboxyl carrier protein